MRKCIAIVTAGVLASALAGCADDASGDDGELTVYFIGSTESQLYSIPEPADGARARFDAVNEAGGIDGQKINFVACNDKSDPNEAAACVRRAAEDKAVAVVGGVSGAGDGITSGLESAQIVYTGFRPLSPGESRSPIAFPLVGGTVVTASGAVLYALNELDCEELFLIKGDIPGTGENTEAVEKAAESVTGETPKGIVTPATATDYSAAASAAADANADCIYVWTLPAEMAKVVPALRNANPDATLITSAGNLPQPIIDGLGPKAEGIVLADTQIPLTADGNEYLEQFQTEMVKYAPDAPASNFALSSWMGADLVVRALEGIDGDVTAAAVLNQFNSMDKVDGHGVIGTFGFGESGPLSDSPRLFNMKYTVFQVLDGAPTLDGPAEFGDVTSALAD